MKAKPTVTRGVWESQKGELKQIASDAAEIV